VKGTGTMKLVQSKSKIRKDMQYIRQQLAFAERAMRNSEIDWDDLTNLFAEMSGVCGNFEGFCNDNATGEIDSYYK
jgi:predicted Mrr-cat superfamily restriction endonuclease